MKKTKQKIEDEIELEKAKLDAEYRAKKWVQRMKDGTDDQCPHCKEKVKINASVCPHCGRDILD